ncbi:hypothetical protein HDV00_006697 [Rhizophlyctis rosea]|nr:hypothetical protein HDV00_006697 [Rhizophlyctis rosea]
MFCFTTPEPVPVHYSVLPDEIWTDIFAFTKVSRSRLVRTCKYFRAVGKNVHVKAKAIRSDVGLLGAIHALVYQPQYSAIFTLDLLNMFLEQGAILSRADVQTVAQTCGSTRSSRYHRHSFMRSSLSLPSIHGPYHPLVIARMIAVGYEKFGNDLDLTGDDHSQFATLLSRYISSSSSPTALPSIKTSDLKLLQTHLQSFSYCPLFNLSVPSLPRQIPSITSTGSVLHTPSIQSLINNITTLCTSRIPTQYALFQTLVANGFDKQSFIACINDDTILQHLYLKIGENLEVQAKEPDYLFLLDRGFSVTPTPLAIYLTTTLTGTITSSDIRSIALKIIKRHTTESSLSTVLTMTLDKLIPLTIQCGAAVIHLLEAFPTITPNDIGAALIRYIGANSHRTFHFPFGFWKCVKHLFPLHHIVWAVCFDCWLNVAEGRPGEWGLFGAGGGGDGKEIGRVYGAVLEGLKGGVRVRPEHVQAFVGWADFRGMGDMYRALVDAARKQSVLVWNEELREYIKERMVLLRSAEKELGVVPVGEEECRVQREVWEGARGAARELCGRLRRVLECVDEGLVEVGAFRSGVEETPPTSPSTTSTPPTTIIPHSTHAAAQLREQNVSQM